MLKPEISKKWFVSSKPDDVKGQELAKAIESAQKALAEAEKGGDAETIDACLEALNSLCTAAERTIKKECDKKKHKDFIETIEKFDRLIQDEISRLQKARAECECGEDHGHDKDEEDGDDEKGVLKPEYLARMIKQLRSGTELNFSFGLDKEAPENSRLVLCNKRKPERLKKTLKNTGEFSNRLMTFGSCIGEGKTLEFRLSEDAKEPAQILKLCKTYLKRNPDLKYKKLRVICGGELFEDEMEGGEAIALAERLRSAATAADVWSRSHDKAVAEIHELRQKLAEYDEPEVASVVEQLESLLEGYPSLDLSSLANAQDEAAYDRGLEKTRQALAAWRRLLKSEVLRVIDENPFVTTNVAGHFDDAVGVIETQLSV